MELEGTTTAPVPNPWRTLWFSPRLTITRIVDAEVRPSWVPVITLAALHLGVGELKGDANGRVVIASSVTPVAWALFDLAFHIVAGPFFVVYVARWFGRNAAVSAIREANVWSYLPFALSIFLWIPGLLLLGPLAASPDAPDHLVLVPIWLGVLAALIWTLVLGVLMLAEVVRASAWKALAITLIASIPGFVLYGIR